MRFFRFIPLVLALSACSNPFGCDEDTRTVDVVPGDGFSTVALGIVDGLRQQGYRCDGVTLRNALGRSIGTTYTCTKC